MGNIRIFNARCSKCYEKHWRGYMRKEHGRKWENVRWVRGTNSCNILECKNCGHRWYSKSIAGHRLRESVLQQAVEGG